MAEEFSLIMQASLGSGGRIQWIQKQIIGGVSGCCMPGQVTAIIGSSGIETFKPQQ